MVTVTAVDIIRYRAELSSNELALRALEMLDDCEGDLEDAAIALAIQYGQEPTVSDRWLLGLAKRWRYQICHSSAKDLLSQDSSMAEVLRSLSDVLDLPVPLITLVAIYVSKLGIDQFCEPLEEKLG